MSITVDAPCPDCGGTPVEKLPLLDGVLWLCPHCGHQELEQRELPDWYQRLLDEGIDPDAPAE